MIDFRYHLISIIAVLLALSVGVVLGSGALGGPLLSTLEGSVRSLRDRNDELLDEVSTLQSRMDEMQRFASEVEARLVDSELEGRNIVLIHVEDMSGGVLDELSAAVGRAGGSVSTRLTLRSKLGLSDDISRDSLALSIGSLSGSEEEIRLEAADVLGRRLAGAAATGRTGGTATTAAGNRAEEFLRDLEEQDFIGIDEMDDDEERAIAADATFIVVGGHPDQPPFDVSGFVKSLSASLGRGGAPTVVAETRESSWDVISSLLEDSEVRDMVATVERVDEVSGRIGVVLALAQVIGGEVDHYGFGSGATRVLPEPSVTSDAP